MPCQCGGGVPGLGRSRDTLCLGTIEDRLERLRADLRIPMPLLGSIMATVLPELYGAPPVSRRGTGACPGSADRRKRYARRVARGRAVSSPKDLGRG